MTLSVNAQIDLLARGCEHIYSREELAKKLGSGRKLRIKLGMDPTAPDIHLGHTVVLRKLRQFQDLGHKAVLIIGDYTARIGDPTGRDTTRPVLSPEDIADNARTYLDQAGKILDTDPDKLELRRNSEWLDGLTFADVLKLTGQVTVQQMLHRENFKKRMAEDKEIAVSEFMYPLMQAYDSVIIESDVELGGTDQTFNNLTGRDLMAKYGQPKQVVMIMPILVGLDGTEKMSKSKGNYVGVTDAADDMYGKVMSITDDMMAGYFELLTSLPKERIDSLLDASTTHPRDAKDALARVIVEEFHDAHAANEASEGFRKRFAKNEVDKSKLPTHEVPAGEHGLADLLVTVGFAESKSKARKNLIAGGAVWWGDTKITDTTASVDVTADPTQLKAGKRNICLVRGV